MGRAARRLGGRRAPREHGGIDGGGAGGESKLGRRLGQMSDQPPTVAFRGYPSICAPLAWLAAIRGPSSPWLQMCRLRGERCRAICMLSYVGERPCCRCSSEGAVFRIQLRREVAGPPYRSGAAEARAILFVLHRNHDGERPGTQWSAILLVSLLFKSRKSVRYLSQACHTASSKHGPWQGGNAPRDASWSFAGKGAGATTP